jgi:protein-S-isoprenylcysteine O-methyltransferase Ste14
MAKRRFLARHRIVRNAIKDDLLYFAIPALLVFSAGLAVSVKGWVGSLAAMWDLIRHPRGIMMLSVPHFVGIALVVTGFTIELIAQITLGRSYSSTLVIRKDHQLITRGIYRFTRHPIYLGVIMVCIGLPAYASSLYGLLIMSAMIPVFLIRIKIEERLLAEEFGDAYRTYKEATCKLIPFIY